jgi:hypothetical protein
MEYYNKEKFIHYNMDNKWFLKNNDFIIWKKYLLKKWDICLIWWYKYFFIKAKFIWRQDDFLNVQLWWKKVLVKKIQYVDKRWFFKKIFEFFKYK